MKIITNNVPRDVLGWHDLTATEQKEFDYLDTDDRRMETDFVRYRGAVYDLSEFMTVTASVAPHCQREGWEEFDGYHTDSYFSAVLVRYVDSNERVIMALALS